jgi:hypothetical protein
MLHPFNYATHDNFIQLLQDLFLLSQVIKSELIAL